jgi:hypothetical protein
LNQPQNYAIVGVAYVYSPKSKVEHFNVDLTVERFFGVKVWDKKK